VIGLGCAGGALLLALIVVTICLCKKKKSEEAEDLVYRVNNSESETNAALV
jgi:hypothetical protein